MANSIKRSEVNRIMREADKFIRSFGYILPPFAYWSPSRVQGPQARGGDGRRAQLRLGHH